MTPNQPVGPFRHGPCPFKGVAKKYLLNLLAKGIGWRKLQSHIRQWTCIFGIVSVITHFACKMLDELLVCLFSNAGLISRLGTSQRYLFCLLFMLICATSGAPSGRITYSGNGASIVCHITTCRKGYEVAPCERTGGTDTCRLCPPDKYQAQDNITSHYKLRCYRVSCPPDTHIPVQYGRESPANPPVCECDVGRNFYKAEWDHAGNCQQKFCGKNEKLVLNGDCVCKDGRERDNNGQCVWKVSPDLINPTTNNVSPTTMKTYSDKRSQDLIPPTSPPSSSPPNYTSSDEIDLQTGHENDTSSLFNSKSSGNVTDQHLNSEPEVTSRGSSDGHRSGETEQTTPNPNNLTTTILWLIVCICVVIGVIGIWLVIYCIRKRTGNRRGSNGEETQKLAVNRDNDAGNAKPAPDNPIIINAKYAQVGNGNFMFHKDENENVSMENEEETDDD